MQNTPLGYDKDEIIITNMNNNIRKSRDAFASQVKSFSGIEEVRRKRKTEKDTKLDDVAYLF